MLSEDPSENDLPLPLASRFSPRFHRLFQQFSDTNQISKTSFKMASNNDGSRSQGWDENYPYKPAPWRSTVSAPACALCNKPVFPAEEVIAASQKYHKLCLKCASCNALLNSGNINEHEKKIYCVGCYRRQFGPQGVGRGLGTTAAAAMTTATSLETPPISPPFERTDLKSNGEPSTTDTDSSQRSVSMISTSSEEDSRLTHSSMNGVTYIGGVSTRVTTPIAPRLSLSSFSSGSSFKMTTVGSNICPRCSKAVYSAEEVKAAGKSFHKRCYTCAHCKKSINAARYSEHEGELYDNNCYQRLFGPRGVGFGIGSGTLSTGT